MTYQYESSISCEDNQQSNGDAENKGIGLIVGI